MLAFKNVLKIYAGGKKAVDNLDLHINAGEFIVFIGPSGCGKTTTMKMINGENIMEKNIVQLRREHS
ncbi:ATP-binding cassette domain-containing protein [Sporosarcina sp. E16_8]|nr:ATP-binding cassette domain-containing protein [Sporosarcina sp. E16_8]